MRVELGSPVIVVPNVARLWHLPAAPDDPDATRTLCRLDGDLYALAGSIRGRRHCCTVCVRRGPAEHVIAGNGPLEQPRRSGGKPKGMHAKITETQLRALHHLHWEQHVPINELGRRYWERLGYRSANACANSLSYLMRDRGLPRHDRIAMTVEASTKNGLSPRNDVERRARRIAAGLTTKGKTRRPACVRCARPAMHGSDFCFAHDPERADQRAQMTAAMRERSPFFLREDLEPAASLVELLHAYKASGGRWRTIADQTGVSEHWIAHVARGCQKRVATERADAIRQALDVEEIAA